MALKKRSKVSAEFSMSSLTDIIFLLLIFFMLTAKFVRIEDFELPTSTSQTMAPVSIVVSIDKAGVYRMNGQEIPLRALERAVRQEKKDIDNQEDATITIVAEVGVPFKKVSKIIQMAGQLKMKAILATQPPG
ncbi:MAG TPA: biopolymer transporter ExbD [Saprospiraceae bacterium]|nr:biopolymer transporter ExbD [Saprospiraceae bacterium]